MTRGLAKPGKHICLGMGIKSITGSRRVLDILNRFGHAINYHTAESLETELATTISYRDKATPDGLLQIPGLATSIAWDNYDEITETLSGSNSLHDTAGICYQNVVPLALDFYQVPDITPKVVPDSIASRLIKLNDDPSPEAMKSLEESDDYISFLNMYIGYTNLSLAGEHDSTAQYWMMYAKAKC